MSLCISCCGVLSIVYLSFYIYVCILCVVEYLSFFFTFLQFFWINYLLFYVAVLFIICSNLFPLLNFILVTLAIFFYFLCPIKVKLFDYLLHYSFYYFSYSIYSFILNFYFTCILNFVFSLFVRLFLFFVFYLILIVFYLYYILLFKLSILYHSTFHYIIFQFTIFKCNLYFDQIIVSFQELSFPYRCMCKYMVAVNRLNIPTVAVGRPYIFSMLTEGETDEWFLRNFKHYIIMCMLSSMKK